MRYFHLGAAVAGRRGDEKSSENYVLIQRRGDQGDRGVFHGFGMGTGDYKGRTRTLGFSREPPVERGESVNSRRIPRSVHPSCRQIAGELSVYQLFCV